MPEKTRAVEEVPVGDLIEFINRVRDYLYLEVDEDSQTLRWDRNKVVFADDFAAEVVYLLDNFGLTPVEGDDPEDSTAKARMGENHV